jgi:hypothetical protein
MVQNEPAKKKLLGSKVVIFVEVRIRIFTAIYTIRAVGTIPNSSSATSTTAQHETAINGHATYLTCTGNNQRRAAETGI